jgi:DNA adenine methylase
LQQPLYEAMLAKNEEADTPEPQVAAGDVHSPEPPHAMPPAKARVNSICPYFGGKRTMAPEIVKQLGPHKYYFEGCAGSMAVIMAKAPAHHETVCDLHGGVTNLAWVLQDDKLAPELFEKLQRVMYDESLFDRSKDWLEGFDDTPREHDGLEADWAYHYFIVSWMGRNGVAGTARGNYQLATRWTHGGGSGPVRFRSAVESIPAWVDRLRNVIILRRDLFDVMPKLEDNKTLAVYVDPPYLHGTMAGGATYLYDFDAENHRQLAVEAKRFKQARVVLSYYDAPALRELYEGWTFIDCSRHKHLAVQNKRGSKRTEAPEVLIINGHRNDTCH